MRGAVDVIAGGLEKTAEEEIRMSARQIPIAAILLKGLSSSRLALVLVLLVIMFSLAGALLPQEGAMGPAEINAWQLAHPRLTAISRSAGLFHVFYSWPFLITVIILGVNTLTCTASHFVKDGGFSILKGPRALQKLGFLCLHISIVLLLVAGAWSAASKLDGYIVLTEGQSFTERHDQYLRLAEGPLHRENHKQFVAVLKQVKATYEKNSYLTHVAGVLDIISDNGQVTQGMVGINRPFTYKGITFTQDQIGFSPRLIIREKTTGRLLLNSFVALKTFRTEQGRQYRDFLPLPFFANRVIVTLYPSYSHQDGKLVTTDQQPDNALLIIERQDESGRVVSQTELPSGQNVTVGDYTLAFADLRRWASFRVVEDPGYLPVCVSLWLGLGALLLRYLPDLRNMFGNQRRADPAALQDYASDFSAEGLLEHSSTITSGSTHGLLPFSHRPAG